MNAVEIFPWSSNFETGIATIDEQHQRLVHLVNLLASHLAYQSDLPTINTIFDELAAYTVYHFQTEEAIWHHNLADDPLEAKHLAVHHAFIRELNQLRLAETNQPAEQVVEDILSFLTNWLAFHILETDKRMAKVVLALQSGLSPDAAKSHADQEMSGALKVLIETILSMYSSLSSRTLQLMKEVVERQKAEAKLRLAANVFEITQEAICIADADLNVIDANPAFCDITLHKHEQVIGRSLPALKPGLAEQSNETAPKIWQAVHEHGHWKGEVWHRTSSGELDAEWLTLSAVKDETGSVINYIAVFSDVGQLIKRHRKMERIANHDMLTGLPNRTLLADRLELAMSYAERTQKQLGVCYLDLDGFKPVNDTLGHAAGDQLLCEIAQRLKATVRSNDTVARIGGDEFVILLNDLNHPGESPQMLGRILEAIAHPVVLNNQVVNVSASIGITVFPEDNTSADLLLQHADQAMYQAKHDGKSRFHCYRPDEV